MVRNNQRKKYYEGEENYLLDKHRAHIVDDAVECMGIFY
jgi:hypothetical protein